MLFYPASAAKYAPSTGIESTLALDDPSIENYFVLCTLPDATFGDPATLTKLAEAAFSYPVDTTVTYAYDQATQTATATYRISTVNVLGGPVKSVNGLMPHHYGPIS
ncbi:hypothetical protein [Sorangium sp. So ce176]|uniref:hypothetical protein n=1 Tax=Sorangium sp. So ce176 TaxID=3133286 RepID=UPI003F649063